MSRKRVLLVDRNTIVPGSLVPKFNSILRVESKLIKTKSRSLDDQYDFINNCKNDIKSLIDRSITSNLSSFIDVDSVKKIGYSFPDLVGSFISNPELFKLVLSKVGITNMDEWISELSEESSTTKARLNRYINSDKFSSIKKWSIDNLVSPINTKLRKLKIGEMSNDYLVTHNDEVIRISAGTRLNEILAIYINPLKDHLGKIESKKELVDNLDYSLEINKSYTESLVGDLITDTKLYDKYTGLVSSICSTQNMITIMNISEEDNSDYDILVVGEEVYNALRDKVELGVRNSNSYRLALIIPSFNLHNGTNISVVDSLGASEENLDKLVYYFGDQISVPKIPLEPDNIRTVTKFDDAKSTLSTLVSFPVGSEFALDYETNAETIYSDRFEMIGFSIANTKSSVYFDMRKIKLEGVPEEYQSIISLLKDFLTKHNGNVWVFNSNFELHVSYKLMHKFFEFCDAGVYHIVDGYQFWYWSLKYTAQFYLNIREWSQNYDGLMDQMVPYLQKGRDEFLSWVKSNKLLSKYYDEVVRLYDNGYNTAYTVIPSDLMGYYGALDSYYTIWIHHINKNRFDKCTVDVFLDNNRLGSRLTGIYVDEELMSDYKAYSTKMYAYTALNAARFALEGEIMYRTKNDLGIENWRNYGFITSSLKELTDHKYSYLLRNNIPINTRATFINNSTDLVVRSLDNYDRLRWVLGNQVFDEIMVIINSNNPESVTPEIRKYFLGVWDEVSADDWHKSVIKYQPILNNIRQYEEIIGCESIRTYDGFMKVDSCLIGYEVYNLDQYERLSLSYFPVTSPVGYKDVFEKLEDVFKHECGTLAISNQKDEYNTFNKKAYDFLYPIKSIDDFIDKMNKVKDGPVPYNRAENIQPIGENDYAQAQKYRYITSNPELYSDFVSAFKNPAVYDFGSPVSLILCSSFGISSKKFQNMLSTYINGAFSKPSIMSSPHDENMVSITEGQTRRVKPRFEVNTKATKRWSSGIHLIFGKSTAKRLFVAPKNYLISYFDISGAEVRTSAYISGDLAMIADFESGKDLYIEFAKSAYPDKPKEYYKKVRKVFKRALLAQLYGQSAESLAGALKMELDEVQRIIDLMFTKYHVLNDYIHKKQEFALENYRVDTFLRDINRLNKNESYGRLRRVGINYIIQGGTAATLAHGFYNLVRQSDINGYGINPIITVHDSVINYVPIKMLGKLNKFYRKNFTDQVFGEVGVKYEFDTMIGRDYTVPGLLDESDDGIVTISGASYGIGCIVDQLDKSDYEIDWIERPDIDMTLTDPIMDLVNCNFDQASFGSSTSTSKIVFKVK